MLLHDLIRDPNTSITLIKAELKQLDAAQQLSNILNSAAPDDHPLHIALMYASADVVSLLLDHDSQITDETDQFFAQRIHPDGAETIKALLHFYRYLQFELSQEVGFSLGKTLALINESMDHLSKFHNTPQEAIIFIGQTRIGKSTLC